MADLQAQEKHVDMEKATLIPYFMEVEKNSIKRMEGAHEANCYLTDQHELLIVQIAKILESMGKGITRLDIHRMILDIINLEEDKQTPYECSEKVLDCLLKKNKDLMKLVSACLLDPARAKRANKQTN